MDANEIVERLKRQTQNPASWNASPSNGQGHHAAPAPAPAPSSGFRLGSDGLLSNPEGRSFKMAESILS